MRFVATWAEFELAAPELAAKGKALLYQYGPPLGFIARCGWMAEPMPAGH